MNYTHGIIVGSACLVKISVPYHQKRSGYATVHDKVVCMGVYCLSTLVQRKNTKKLGMHILKTTGVIPFKFAMCGGVNSCLVTLLIGPSAYSTVLIATHN